MRASLLLIRGLPGAGKSTMAASLRRSGAMDVHLEADMYHMQADGSYVYDKDKAFAAHRWCLETTRVMLSMGRRVVVANTFVTREEIQPYLDLGFSTEIVKATGSWRSVHNVPEEIMEYMRSRWEEIE